MMTPFPSASPSAFLGFDVVYRVLRLVKDLVSGGGDAVFLHELLREDLAALDDGGVLSRTEGSESLFLEPVDHAEHQRVVGRDEDDVRLQLLSGFDDAFDVCRFDRQVLADGGGSAVAGSAPELAAVGAFFEAVGDGVFASAAAYYQYVLFHFVRYPSL